MTSLFKFLLLALLYMSPTIGASLLENNIEQEITFDEKNIRYQIIKKILDQYKRPFALLDVGANQGFYSLKTAYHYDAVCVMLEANNTTNPHISDQLLDICNTHKQLSNIIFLNKQFKTADLQHLSECEHFDVVLAMNVLCRFGDCWQEALDAILNMGDHVIVEINAQEQTSNVIEDYIIMRGGYILGTVPTSTSDTYTKLYIVESHKKYLQRKTWLLPKMKKNNYSIESSFTEKTLTKEVYWPRNAQQTTSWVPGINMLTFKMCNGVYPTKETIKASMRQLKEFPHTDWMINNMVIQGNKLVWIDTDDTSRSNGALLKPTKFSESGMQAHEMLIDLDDPQKIEHYFWHRLIWIPIAKKHRVKLIGRLLPAASLVFDIIPDNDTFIETCLGYGAKIICFDLLERHANELCKKFENEDVIIVDNEIIKHNIGEVTLDNMIALYGSPHLCAINLDNLEAIYSLLKGLSQRIPYIMFKFDVRSLSELDKCLQHLINVGYTEFNFSVRDIPLFTLDKNKHTGCTKEWASSVEDLLKEIQHFAALDHDSNNVWGYVYAHYQ